MTLGRWWPGALALGVLAAGLAAWAGRSGNAPAPPPPAAALHALPQPLPATRRSSLARPAAASTPAELPLAAQVDRLLASHDPEDAYAAYRLIADCAEFSDKHDRMVFDRREAARAPKDTFMAGYRGMTDDEKRHDAVFCANLTERQRQSRLDALAVAAQAGVSGAAVAFLDAGPFGDPSALKTRPDDPLVQAWKATATAQLQLAADAGDVGTLFYFAPALLSGSDAVARNPQLAYRYSLALGEIQTDMFGDNPMSRYFTQRIPQMLESELDPATRAAEQASAHRIATLEKARRERAAREAQPD